MELPRKIYIEDDAIKKVKEIQAGKILVIADETTYKIAGKDVLSFLKKREVEVRMISKDVDIKTDADFIIAVGGGKIIDIGKLVALQSGAELIAIPTAPSHDGIFSPTITLPELGIYTKPARPAYMVIADMNILRNAPSRLIRAGIGDALSKYTSVYDWRLAAKRGEEYSELIADMAWNVFEHTAKNLERILAGDIKPLIESLFYSGLVMCIWGSSRPVSGSEHAFGHAATQLGSSALHGEQVALGTLIMAYLQGQDWKRIKSLLDRAGLPITAKGIGMQPKGVVEAVVRAKDIRQRWTILNEIDINEKRAEKACRAVGVF
ncbi:MAG: iron-containing alcohol dehydrogenase [Candidatus Aenigmatarchaeota archaeon]